MDNCANFQIFEPPPGFTGRGSKLWGMKFGGGAIYVTLSSASVGSSGTVSFEARRLIFCIHIDLFNALRLESGDLGGKLRGE